MTKIGLWLGAAAVAALAYITAISLALQQGLGASATAIVRPLVIPLIELINVPAFVYCAALVFFMAGLAACVVYQIAAVRPYLAELRAVRSAGGDLPQPRLNGVVKAEAWAEARQHLGTLLRGHALFVAAWSAFRAESPRGRGVPSRPFSSFVGAEPSDGGPSGSSPPKTVRLGNVVRAFVERTIAWLNRCRRLAKDWERLNQNALTFLRWASIRMMLRRLCQNTI